MGAKLRRLAAKSADDRAQQRGNRFLLQTPQCETTYRF
jgi:hypothetical protein